MDWPLLQSEPRNVHEKIGALRNEFTEDSTSESLVFEISILAGLLLLLSGFYFIISRRIGRQSLVRRGDVDGGVGRSFEFEFDQLQPNSPALFFFDQDGKRVIAEGRIRDRDDRLITFETPNPVIASPEGRLVAFRPGKVGRAFRVSVTNKSADCLFLRSIGAHPVETFGETRRVELEIAARLAVRGQAECATKLHDLSRTGAGMTLDHEISSRSRGVIALKLPTRSGAFEVEFKIRWRRPDPSGIWRYGVHFSNPDPVFKAHLHDFLSQVAEAEAEV